MPHNKAIKFLNPDVVVNPYQTASLVAKVNDEYLIFSTIGGWDPQTGVLLPDPGERASQTYYNIWQIGRAVGADPEDAYRILVYALADPQDGNRIYNLYRDRLSRETIEQYGGALMIGPPFSGRFIQVNNTTQTGPLVATNNDNLAIPSGFKFPCRVYSGLIDSQAAGPLAALAEYYIKDNKPHDGQRHFQLENPPYNKIYPVAAPISHLSMEGDFARTTGTRAYRKRAPGTGNFPAATWFEWEQVPNSEAAVRVDITWYDHIKVKGEWIQAGFERLYKTVIQWVDVPGTDAIPKTEAVLKNIYGQGPYPLLDMFQVPETGPFDSYEVIPDWYLGKKALKYNAILPYLPKGPYSNSVRAGDYVFTSLMTHFNSQGQPVGATPYEKAYQAYSNMFAAAKALGAKKSDLYKVNVYVSVPIAEYSQAIDDVTRQFWGEEGPFPPRSFTQVTSITYGGEISVSGQFFAPKCKKQC